MLIMVSKIMNNKKYGVILTDCPWQYGNFGAKKHGAVKSHYETQNKIDLKKIPVGSMASKDCILLHWATWPKLDVAMDVAKAWGFDYVTGIPWVKTSPSSGNIRTGIGFWFQRTSEMLLVFRKGKSASPDGNATKTRKPVKGLLCGEEWQFYAPTKGHSEKPLSIYDWARAKLKGPYLELFARNKIYGWDCYGYELGHWISDEGITKLSQIPYSTVFEK